MSIPEAIQEAPPNVIEAALQCHPPLPVGRPDIFDVVLKAKDAEPSVPGYAWERLAAWLADTGDAFRAGDGPIIYLDLCSSTPLLIQRARASEFDRSGSKARAISYDLLKDDALQHLKSSPDTSQLMPVAHALTRNTEGRDLLASAVQKALYCLTREESENEGVLFERLRESLLFQDSVYEKESPDSEEGIDLESAWGIRFSERELGKTYLETVSSLEIPTEYAVMAGQMLKEDDFYQDLLAMTHQKGRDGTDIRKLLKNDQEYTEIRELAREKIPVGEELARQLIDWQAAMLAKVIVGNKAFRPARFFSMDSAEPHDIAISSIKNTPPSTQKMNLFAHALDSLGDPRQHIVGNVLEELPVPDCSVTLMTCYDGWPFYFHPEGDSIGELSNFAVNASNVLQGYYNKLAHNGKLVIFPWATAEGDTQASEMLDWAVCELARRVGLVIERRTFHREFLGRLMSDSDRQTSRDRSPIFRSDKQSFEALIITKPRKSLVEALGRNIGGIATQARNLGWPDPTP